MREAGILSHEAGTPARKKSKHKSPGTIPLDASLGACNLESKWTLGNSKVKLVKEENRVVLPSRISHNKLKTWLALPCHNRKVVGLVSGISWGLSFTFCTFTMCLLGSLHVLPMSVWFSGFFLHPKKKMRVRLIGNCGLTDLNNPECSRGIENGWMDG